MKLVEIRRDSGSVDLDELHHFELAYGIKFPSKYKKLMSQHNACFLQKPNFEFFNSASERVDSRDISFLGFGKHLRKDLRIDNSQDHDVYGHDKVIVFGVAANGDFICFDYRKIAENGEPNVVVMFHDISDLNNKLLVNFVADTFEELMDSLSQNDDLA